MLLQLIHISTGLFLSLFGGGILLLHFILNFLLYYLFLSFSYILLYSFCSFLLIS